MIGDTRLVICNRGFSEFSSHCRSIRCSQPPPLA